MPNWFQHKFIAILLYEHARYHTPSSFYFLSIKSGRWFFLSELFHDIHFFSNSQHWIPRIITDCFVQNRRQNRNNSNSCKIIIIKIKCRWNISVLAMILHIRYPSDFFFIQYFSFSNNNLSCENERVIKNDCSLI